MSALSSISTGDLTIFQPLQNLTSQQQSRVAEEIGAFLAQEPTPEVLIQ